MTEAFLHYVWLHRMLAEGLTTTDGQPVEVIRAGDLNRDAGPDFFNARLRIGGVEWIGNVEVHVHTSDWKAHGHSSDKAYNSIVLHVVYEHDCEIRLENGNIPPTLELKNQILPAPIERYAELINPTITNGIPCGKSINEVPRFIIDAQLERLLVERIEAKAEVVHRMLNESHGGWEQTCYWLIARYFGGKVNALPFELLAKATDQRLLARWKDNPERLEALLMGQAGLLEGYFEDDYPRRLQADYEALCSGTTLQPIDSSLWKFYCLRPSSFPTIRISQFARMVSQSKNLFSTLLECNEVEKIEQLFNQTTSEYWETHYHFDQPTKKRVPKRIGKTQADLLIINAWVPLLFVYGAAHGQNTYKEQALDLLRQLPPEDNQVIRLWTSLGFTPTHAGQSQAQLQLKNNYCNPRRCLECSIGYHLIKQK